MIDTHWGELYVKDDSEDLVSSDDAFAGFCDDEKMSVHSKNIRYKYSKFRWGDYVQKQHSESEVWIGRIYRTKVQAQYKKDKNIFMNITDEKYYVRWLLRGNGDQNEDGTLKWARH